jgi:hypothetical protein
MPNYRDNLNLTALQCPRNCGGGNAPMLVLPCSPERVARQCRRQHLLPNQAPWPGSEQHLPSALRLLADSIPGQFTCLGTGHTAWAQTVEFLAASKAG